MPTYVYRREDGSTFEIVQRITEDPLQACPTTGQPVTRIISGNAGLIFKGSGFYLTDYARKNGGGELKEGTPAKDTAETSTTSDTKSDTKSADAGSSGGDKNAGAGKADG